MFYHGAVTDLGTLQGDYASSAIGINNAGQIVGISLTAGPVGQAFLYENGLMKGLGTLPGASSSSALAINSSGAIVGYSENPGSVDPRAFLYINGKMRDLSTDSPGGPEWAHSIALAIGDSGTILGYAFNKNADDASYKAFIDSNGAMVDLNSLVVNGQGWHLRVANGINHSGQIIGYGSYEGEIRAFLLTPVPEPSALALSVLGAVGLMACRSRFRRSD